MGDLNKLLVYQIEWRLTENRFAIYYWIQRTCIDFETFYHENSLLVLSEAWYKSFLPLSTLQVIKTQCLVDLFVVKKQSAANYWFSNFFDFNY